MVEAVLALALSASAPQSLSFEDAVAHALAHHPALKVAQKDVERAVALVEQSRSASMPTLYGTLGYTRLDDDRKLGDRVIAGKDQLSGNVTAALPLVSARTWAQWWRVDQARLATAATADDVKRVVAVGAARAWLLVLAQGRVLEAAERAHTTSKAHFDYAHDRRAGGVGTRLDELRAAQELSVSEQAVATAQGALARAEETLAVAIAADGPVSVAKGEPLFDTPKADEALKTAETVRRDVKAAQVRADVAHKVTTLDWTEYVPLLSAVFQPFTQNPPSLIQPLYGWQAQLVLTVPFYEGGLRYGQMHERRALADSADAQLENTLRQAKSEVRAAFEGVKHADEALLAARESAKQAAEALDLANVSYQAGATTNLEVIDAERRARDAETQVAVAEDAARQARLDVLAASGRFP